ncbi:unannotated protein [freshwater metagenome]|uniref:Unannotated protein n=1 Tax=freshwater metagenome TaxID=449393 RepID=A0A6J7Q365_9ZZZZ|nr:hypothetical protein [Actinomycetota bacterium]MSW24498.1 hypothetical protein [Actinomycetota bacterium]MSX44019.1 hypothetical protein [Actinomycetota bacterium]MSX97811.1 hypothetical protein [Actinomycetota bacterium]
MPTALWAPPAVIIALWINSARKSAVTTTDAINALETIVAETNSAISLVAELGTELSGGQVARLGLSAPDPVSVGLPIPGDPAGVPATILSQIEASAGVVALDREHLLVQHREIGWQIIATPHAIVHQDLNFAKTQLTSAIALAANFLSQSDLVGDHSKISESLQKFRTLHLPPNLNQKHVESLELAARVHIVATGAIADSEAVASPSQDRMRVQVLRNLERDCLQLLQAGAIC